MARFTQIIIGGAMIAAGVVAIAVTGGAAAPWAMMLIKAGVMVTLTGTGTLLAGMGSHLSGTGTATRNPIAPWNSVYGRAKIGGAVVYLNEFGQDNKYLDMVCVLACHPCRSVDALIFDGQRVLLNANGDSFTPTQQTFSISTIVRSNGVVTVTMSSGFAYLETGDPLIIKNVSGDATLNGKYLVTVITSTSFSYVCGGSDVSLSGDGEAETAWPDYRSKIHMETLLGDHTTTFPGMLYGTPYDGDLSSIVQPSSNPWTSQHLLLGKCAVFLRMHYNDEVFSMGLPQISFHISGKTDIYDPRTDTVLQRPTVLSNGWGGNAHVGAYEEGVDQGYGWGLDGSTTEPYSNAGGAVDGDLGSYAYCTLLHTHTYAGCIWKFSALGSTPSDLYLNILSAVPTLGAGQLRSAGVWYTLNGGTSWTQIYNQASRVKQWDNIHLSTSQDCSQVQVMAFLDAHDDETHYIYDIQLGTAPATSGYTENAALCIADYLANQTWGFKAAYGTEIPNDKLIAAANICDENVALAAGGTEKRYTCNGTFPLTMKRGEVLQNLLTSCAGRLTYSGGEYVIHPAAWPGVAYSIGNRPVTSAIFYAITSHTGGDYAEIFVNDDTHPMAWGSSDPLDFGYRMQDNAAYGTRTDTLVTFTDTDTATLYSKVASFRIHGAESGHTPDVFTIYDCYADVTFADGSTATFRATQSGTATNGFTNIGTSIANAAAAYDSDPATAATITFPAWSIFAQYSTELQLTGFVPVSGGGPDLSAGGIAASAATLSNAAGPFRWHSDVSMRDLFNGVKGTYISPLNNWQSSDIPPYAQDEQHGYASDANLAADGGDRRWLDIQLPFTISAATAQRIAKIELLRRRYRGNGTFAFNMAMYKTTALDIVQFTLPLLGWTNKLLEISAHRFKLDRQEIDGAEVTLLGTELDVQETDPSVYEWSTSEELTAQGYQQANLLNGSQGSVAFPPGDIYTVNGT
jgi:hypothetical protein